ncbi:hypothetical protein ODJ79_42250 [Actinoplanes sp. KI2]|uniref:hypothetical protein n=1 Tax=Actinoplanes sp. KI2 TaxID=2983315 RepID=UPI0021D5BB6E|nr:hypothetical protein [Actinoplanes sp. KI2]MCU7730381.1 hypothetical protein [Actinoplanes sp. KI2]
MSFAPHLHRALDQARQTIWDGHRQDPNFTGCGIGYRRRAGVITDEPVVVAMVVDKIPAAALSRRRLLPTEVVVDGVAYGVDVVEAGPVYASGLTTTGPITQRLSPPQPGVGVSNVQADKSLDGTLGCFVTDTTDNTVGFLSAAHILGRMNAGSAGENVVQPATVDGGTDPDDVVAKTKRYISLTELQPNTLDVGLAQLTDKSAYKDAFVFDLMDPISGTHQAVGMCVASDNSGNSFLCRMDHALTALKVVPTAWPHPDAAVAPAIDMNIEKVGRTSGYTSTKIAAIGVSLNARMPDGATYPFSDMIWTQFLHIAGDSGAVACQGGDGNTFVLPPSAGSNCPLAATVERYYGLPTLAANNTLTNRVQSQFLAQSLTGNLLIGMVYMNMQTVIDRLASHTGPAYNQAAAQAVVQQYYNKYRPVAAAAMVDPSSFVVTRDLVYDSAYLIQMLNAAPADGGQGLFTPEEYQPFGTAVLMGFSFWENNYTYQQIIDFMNQPDVYNTIFDQFAAAPTLHMP